MKKISSFILAIAMIISMAFVMNLSPITAHAADASVWDGTTITQPTSMKTIDGVYYYEISTAEELAYIAKTGGEWLRYNYILANDIVLNNAELKYDINGNLTVDESDLNLWTPIDNFDGIFDGNNFSIYGVYIVKEQSAGFFTSDVFESEPIIKNLHLKNSYVKGKYTVGGVIDILNGKIENCSYDGAVVGEGITQDTTGVGGVIGHAGSDYPISNIINYGLVVGECDVGGIVGSQDNGCGISYCTNNGYVVGERVVGGIIGSNVYYSGKISNCTNTGKIVSKRSAGGIIGSGGDSVGVANCQNEGIISGSSYVGGIAGGGGAIISSSLNLGSVCGQTYVGGISGSGYSKIDFCFNIGDVSGTSYIGGIIGNLNETTLNKNFNLGNVIGEEYVGGIAGFSNHIWGKGSVRECYYLKNSSVNATLTAFGNVSDDVDGVANAKDDSFFCVNSDKTLNTSGHQYSSTIPCDATCDNCGYERTVTHTYDNIKYDSDKHWHECDCGEVKPDSEESHTGGTATCISKAKCSVRKQSYGSLSEHNFNVNAWGYKTNDGHAHACQTSGCSEHDTVVAHTSSGAATENVAETCTKCGYIISPALGHKLSGGAIVGIAVGSTAVVGIGGFSLIWFVVKKKSWADLLAVFKK